MGVSVGAGTGPTRAASGGSDGLYWLVAGLAERAPLALCLDDAQWLDSASARFVVYLARRLSSLPALLSVAMRSDEDLLALACERALAERRPIRIGSTA